MKPRPVLVIGCDFIRNEEKEVIHSVHTPRMTMNPIPHANTDLTASAYTG